MIRGGSWSDNAAYCRVAYRNYDGPSDSGSSYGLGFRVARSSIKSSQQRTERAATCCIQFQCMTPSGMVFTFRSILLVLVAGLARADEFSPPTSYYGASVGLTGSSLDTALRTFVGGHSVRTYDQHLGYHTPWSLYEAATALPEKLQVTEIVKIFLLLWVFALGPHFQVLALPRELEFRSLLQVKIYTAVSRISRNSFSNIENGNFSCSNRGAVIPA